MLEQQKAAANEWVQAICTPKPKRPLTINQAAIKLGQQVNELCRLIERSGTLAECGNCKRALVTPHTLGEGVKPMCVQCKASFAKSIPTEAELEPEPLEWYRQNLAGDFGSMTDVQIQGMRATIIADDCLTGTQRAELVADCDNAIARIERGE